MQGVSDTPIYNTLIHRRAWACQMSCVGRRTFPETSLERARYIGLLHLRPHRYTFFCLEAHAPCPLWGRLLEELYHMPSKAIIHAWCLALVRTRATIDRECTTFFSGVPQFGSLRHVPPKNTLLHRGWKLPSWHKYTRGIAKNKLLWYFRRLLGYGAPSFRKKKKAKKRLTSLSWHASGGLIVARSHSRDLTLFCSFAVFLSHFCVFFNNCLFRPYYY